MEAFMVMSLEKQVLGEVDFQNVLEIIKNSLSLWLKFLLEWVKLFVFYIFSSYMHT